MPKYNKVEVKGKFEQTGFIPASINNKEIYIGFGKPETLLPKKLRKFINKNVKVTIELDKPKKEKPNFVRVRGNKDGNFVEFEQMDDNTLRLEFGDCCIYGDRIIITAEALSSFLMDICLEKNMNLLEVIKSYMRWDEETNEKFSKGCKIMKNGEWEDG